MRRRLVLLVLALGCPPPSRYAVMRPGLECERATRVAYRTLVNLGCTVTDVVLPRGTDPGVISARRVRPDGKVDYPRVMITCDGSGAKLQPYEDALVPDYEFSRAFDYSFTSLVQRPDVEQPSAGQGLEVLVQVVTPGQAVLDLHGVPTAASAVPVRFTVRNHTDRAVALDPARVTLVPAGDGPAAEPLAGAALAAAFVPGPAADHVRSELLGARKIPPRSTVTGFLVYPAGTYREARISIEDVETTETEGFVAPVQ